MLWFVKAKRAQSNQDDETWLEGGVVPTLNAFDNGDTRATVIIIMRQREGKPGGGKGPMLGDKSFTLATNNDQTVFGFSHTQGLDSQPTEEGTPTLRANGAGMAVAYSPSGFADYSESPEVGTLKAGMTNNNSPILAFDPYNHTTSDVNQTLRTGSDLDKMGTIIGGSVVRRLTPTECERLQGFPDGWTEGQADSTRYKQMGNAVAVPVVDWIVSNLVK
jgi:site-specific DNA-cytosine methylase